MTKRTKAQKNLLLARFAHPYCTWKVSRDGKVVNDYEIFDIEDTADCTAVMIKLKRDHNITIKDRTSDGKTVWEAISQDGPDMRGSHKHSDLVELLVQVVEGLKDG